MYILKHEAEHLGYTNIIDTYIVSPNYEIYMTLENIMRNRIVICGCGKIDENKRLRYAF